MTETGNCLVGPDEEPDKYQLVSWMAGGGEADLWAASVTLAGDQERVAVKILHPDHFKDVNEWRSRWSEQVELLRLIQNPGVVGVHCHFEGARMHLPGQANLTDRTLYMVMNWVDGQALQDWVPLHHHPDNQTVGLRYLSQVAAVLDCLHTGQATSSRRIIVHGDISPANVIINTKGQAVLVDFGLFRIAAQSTAEVVGGTPGYCAPEVVQRGDYSVASDRYAFGALAYFVLTGQHPPSDLAQLREGARAIPWLGDQPERIEHLLTMFAEEPESRPSPGVWIRGLRMHASTVLPGSAPLPPLPPRRGRGASPGPSEDAAVITAEPAAPQGSRSTFVTIFVLLVVLAGYVAVRESHQQQAARAAGASPASTAGTVAPPAPTKAPIPQTSPVQKPPIPSEPPRELSLTDIAPVETDNGMNYGHGYDIGPEKVNTQQHERTLSTKDCTTSATWQLDRKYNGLRTSVGLSDASRSSEKLTFSVLVDGETKAVYPVSVGALQSIPVVNLHDAFRVTLKVQSESFCSFGDFSGKAVWINPVVS